MPIGNNNKPNPATLSQSNVVKPRRTFDQLMSVLNRYDRTPFTEALGIFLHTLPSPEAIDKLKENDPYRWAQTLKTLAQLHGFTETSEVIVRHRVEDMSDMELIRFIAQNGGGKTVLEAHSERVARENVAPRSMAATVTGEPHPVAEMPHPQAEPVADLPLDTAKSHKD